MILWNDPTFSFVSPLEIRNDIELFALIIFILVSSKQVLTQLLDNEVFCRFFWLIRLREWGKRLIYPKMG